MTAEGVAMDSIHVLMGRVLAELPAIGKDSYNNEQKFAFRGIDDVLNGLNPILSKHGVFFVPTVLERVKAERTTRSGGVMHEVNLHVRFRFYGPLGDFVEASGWGEGTDMGDKATNKAMTGAMKYVLFQTFAISTKEAADDDADRHQAEETVSADMAAEDARRAALDVEAKGQGYADEQERVERHRALAEKAKALPTDTAKAEWRTFAEGLGERPYDFPTIEKAEIRLAEIEAKF